MSGSGFIGAAGVGTLGSFFSSVYHRVWEWPASGASSYYSCTVGTISTVSSLRRYTAAYSPQRYNTEWLLSIF